MIKMVEREAGEYREKYAFLRYYDRLTAAREFDPFPFTETEQEVQKVLTEAMLNEDISAKSFVALVVHAYA